MSSSNPNLRRQAFIALGSNLGNRKAYLRRAINNLEDVVKVSGLYETDPVGYDDQDPFLNIIVQLETDLTPRQLLDLCQEQEQLAQRQREILNGPRTLDMDVLWVQGEEVNEPDLIVPHPRMFERGFVMIPLNDLQPDITKSWMEENMGKGDTYPGVHPVGELDLNEPKPIPISTTKASLTEFANSARAEGASIGLVPTLGGLHSGHTSLIRQSQKENSITIVTIFLNPLQFNKTEDLNSYPKNRERDLETLESFSPDLIFMPDQTEMLPEPIITNISVGHLTNELEGEFRPGHLAGVCAIVLKLFNIVGQCNAYFGEKDFQQLMMVSRLVSDLDLPVKIVPCPTVREPSGLALSSRNVLLDESQKELATHIFKALASGQELVQELAQKGSEIKASEVEKFVKKILLDQRGIKLEYLQIRNSQDFLRPTKIAAPARILLAAKVGNVRLIDNVEIYPFS